METCIACKGTDIQEIVRNELPMFMCSACGLVWRREFDLPDSHYVNDSIHLDEQSIRARSRNTRDRIRLLERYVAPNDLCDIGAGEGTFLWELQKRGYRNVIGIEPNTKAVAYAKTKGVRIFEGNIFDVEKIIAEHHIRIVSLFHVIEHLEDPRSALEAIFRALKPGDHLIVETPNAEGYGFVKSNYKHPLVYPAHLYYFNTKNLPRLLEDIGFTIYANGKRGFDQYNMSIREALFALGFLRAPFAISGEEKGKDRSVKRSEPPSSPLRTFARKALSLLVVALGRLDYQWVIATK